MTKAGKGGRATAGGETIGTGSIATVEVAALSAYLSKTIDMGTKRSGTGARNDFSYIISASRAALAIINRQNTTIPHSSYSTAVFSSSTALYNTSAT